LTDEVWTELTKFTEFMKPDCEYDVAGKVIGLAMKVHRTLGSGFLETIYQRALQIELLRAGFKVDLEQPIQVRYEGAVVGDFLADIVVNDSLIIEIKAIASLAPAHEVQLVNYLTATGKDEGLLLNFGRESLEFKKKFRAYKQSANEPFVFRENSVNSVNSVQIKC
jgi:GxxExxY protein